MVFSLSTEMKQFAESYSFYQITSGLKHPQSNSLVDRIVQTVKGIKSNSIYPCMALLSYRATPLPWCKLSPAELFMRRKVRADIPQASSQLCGIFDYFSRKRQRVQATTEEADDQQHRVKDQEPLDIDVPIWMTSEREPVSG